MELGEFRIKLPDELEESPGPANGRAEVRVPEPEPLPNANTVEGMIAGYGVIASRARRGNRSARILVGLALATFGLPAVITLIVAVVNSF